MFIGVPDGARCTCIILVELSQREFEWLSILGINCRVTRCSTSSACCFRHGQSLLVTTYLLLDALGVSSVARSREPLHQGILSSVAVGGSQDRDY